MGHQRNKLNLKSANLEKREESVEPESEEPEGAPAVFAGRDDQAEGDLGYDELYYNQAYAHDFGGTERYARKRNRDEYFVQDDDGHPLKYAKIQLPDGKQREFYPLTAQNERIVLRREKRDVYPENENGEAIYGVQSYDLSEDGSQIYPLDSNGNEKYLVDAKGQPMFALDKDNLPFYAQMKSYQNEIVEFLPEDHGIPWRIPGKYPFNYTTGKPIYPYSEEDSEMYWKDVDGNEVYGRDRVQDQIYAVDSFGNEIYAKTHEKSEYCATRENGTPYYAFRYNEDDDSVEYLPKDATGKTLPLPNQYPMNKTLKEPIYFKVNENSPEEYLRDPDGNEFYALHPVNGRQVYAKKGDLIEKYAKTKDGVEFPAVNAREEQYYASVRKFNGEMLEIPFLGPDKKPKYIADGPDTFRYLINFTKKRPIYDLEAGSEKYWVDSQQNEYYGCDQLGGQIYARDAKRKEFPVTLANKSRVYARDANKIQKYPITHKRDQYYLETLDGEEFPIETLEGYRPYAKTVGGDEFYPKKTYV